MTRKSTAELMQEFNVNVTAADAGKSKDVKVVPVSTLRPKATANSVHRL